MKRIFFNGTYDTPSAAANEFNAIFAGLSLGHVWSTAQSIIVPAGKLRKYRHIIQTAPGASKSYTFEYIVGGSTQTNVEVTLSDSETDETYSGDAYVLTDYDQLGLRSVPAGTPGATGYNRWCAEWEGINVKETFIGSVFDLPVKSATRYHSVNGDGGWVTTDALACNICPLNGTITKFCMATSAGVGINLTYTVKIVKNGSAEASSTITFTSVDGLAKQVTGLSIDMAPGDLFSYECTIAGAGTTAARAVKCTMIFEPDIRGENWICGRSSDLLAASATTEYGLWEGCNDSWFTGANEANSLSLVHSPFIMKSLYWVLDAASSVDFTLKSRISGSNGNLTSTITAGNTSGSDLSNSDSYVNGDFIGLSMTSSGADGTPPAASWAAIQFVPLSTQDIVMSGVVPFPR